MCDTCNVLGYEIEDGCPVCGCEGAVGVYLDGSGCWECAKDVKRPEPALEDVLGAMLGLRPGTRPGAAFFGSDGI